MAANDPDYVTTKKVDPAQIAYQRVIDALEDLDPDQQERALKAAAVILGIR